MSSVDGTRFKNGDVRLGGLWRFRYLYDMNIPLAPFQATRPQTVCLFREKRRKEQ